MLSVTTRVLPKPPEQRMNYADLHFELRESDSVTPQSYKNMASAMKTWLECHQLDLDCPVGPELNGLFVTAVEQYKNHLTANGVRQQTAADKVSLMSRWKRFFRGLSSAQKATTSFAAALADAVEKSPITRAAISKSVGIWELTLREWLRGERVPQNKHRAETIPQLEKVLRLSKGTLTALLPPPPPLPNREKTSYQKALPANLRNPYAIRDVPGTLKEEWKAYVRFKTMPVALGFKRSTSWRKRAANSLGYDYGWESSIGDEVCPSASIAWLCIANVLGFAVLPLSEGGLGYKSNALTLATLADASIYINLVSYMHTRAGAYNNGHVNSLAQVKAMLRPSFGYLYQNAVRFGALYPHGPLSGEQFKAECEKSYNHLCSLSKDIQSSAVLTQSRSPSEPIQNILDMQHPLSALYEMIEAMKQAAPTKAKPVEHAVYLRNILLMQMMAAAPVRINQFALMTYKQDNTGNLYKADGGWWIRFVKKETKNSKQYNVRLYESTYAAIESYISKYRSVLLAGIESDYFFRTKTKADGRGGLKPLSVNYLTAIFLNITRRYIKDSPGFGPHAFRYIIATDFLKNHPGQYELAAALLDDEVDTVIRHYAHLNKVDMHEKFNVYSAEIEKSVLARLKEKVGKVIRKVTA